MSPTSKTSIDDFFNALSVITSNKRDPQSGEAAHDIETALKFIEDNKDDAAVMKSTRIWADTPLMHACFMCEPAVVTALINTPSVDVNFISKGSPGALHAGMGALHVASSELHLPTITALLQSNRLDIGLRTASGLSALDVAHNAERAWIAQLGSQHESRIQALALLTAAFNNRNRHTTPAHSVASSASLSPAGAAALQREGVFPSNSPYSHLDLTPKTFDPSSLTRVLK